MALEQAEPRVRADAGYEQTPRKESETQKDFLEEAVGTAFRVVDVWHAVGQVLPWALAKQGQTGDQSLGGSGILPTVYTSLCAPSNRKWGQNKWLFPKAEEQRVQLPNEP